MTIASEQQLQKGPELLKSKLYHDNQESTRGAVLYDSRLAEKVSACSEFAAYFKLILSRTLRRQNSVKSAEALRGLVFPPAGGTSLKQLRPAPSDCSSKRG